MMPLNPCFDPVSRIDCPHRSANCSVSCPKWKEYAAERDAEYERRRADKSYTAGYTETNDKLLKYIQRKQRRNMR